MDIMLQMSHLALQTVILAKKIAVGILHRQKGFLGCVKRVGAPGKLNFQFLGAILKLALLFDHADRFVALLIQPKL